MAKTLKVEVTQEDIDKAMGQPMFPKGGWATRCPIAQALRRTGFNDVQVGLYGVSVDEDDYDLTEKARDYIKNVDRTHNAHWRRLHPTVFLNPVLPATFTFKEVKRRA